MALSSGPTMLWQALRTNTAPSPTATRIFALRMKPSFALPIIESVQLDSACPTRDASLLQHALVHKCGKAGIRGMVVAHFQVLRISMTLGWVLFRRQHFVG